MAAQHKVEVYSSPFCSYCHRTKSLLRGKGITFTEHDVVATPSFRENMLKRSGGRRTVPQIFIDDVHIGGCDDLLALESQGKLDTLLAQSPA